MKVMVIGNCGREHVIARTLSKSPQVTEIIGTPENIGINQIPNAVCFDLKPDDIQGQIALAIKQKVGLVIIGPELPLAAGLADRLRAEHIPVVGPSQAAARIESSKIFCKKTLFKYGIPTADFICFCQVELARKYIYSLNENDYPVVIKADGLAAGKGVIVAQNQRVAILAINDMMVRAKFGEAGKKIIIERFLTGRECSIIAAVDAKGNIVVFPPSRDYKRAMDRNQGRNTGGMGAYSPLSDVTPTMLKKIQNTIIEPTLAGLAKENCPYQGIIYFGLMIDSNKNIYVLEINCRFGDPETQVLLPLLQSDFAEMMMATATGGLAGYTPQWSDEYVVCVVLASQGYPGKYKTGVPIVKIPNEKNPYWHIIHAGTTLAPGGGFITNGGRVLNVVATGNSLSQARTLAYLLIGSDVNFKGMHYRRDIAS